ncbi:helicase-associated domain-containing protein [Paenibacillus sp. 1001270B_150601_E10]|uniref:helicase-associated domain-containing protein n=1 Tax=Paenibacillus sp. 1001270B_150601_E10 TaxID=2787079 RepID=UPI00189D9107|nr:helicase-associated domain-containing protein [Paenibacillus sp. 1001270B_150601_E10]
MKLSQLRMMMPRTDDEHPVAQKWRKYEQSEQAIIDVYERLSPELKKIYKVLMQLAGPLPFDQHKLEAWNGQCEECPIGYVCAALPVYMGLGLLAPLKWSWDETLYVIPRDIYEAVLSRQAEERLNDKDVQYEGSLLDLSPVPPSSSIEAGEGVVHDLFRLMVMAAKGELSLTSKGLLPKKTIQRIEGALQIKSDGLTACNVQFSPLPFASPALSFLLDIACSLKMLTKHADRYQAEPNQLKHWLACSPEEWRQAIYDAVLEQYLPQEIDLHQGIIELALGGHASEWRSVQGMTASVQALYHKPQRLLDKLQAWLLAAHTLGLCDLGECAGEWFYRWQVSKVKMISEPAWEISPSLFVQPDFEIIAAPECSFSVRYELEMIAELQASEPLAIYRLTKDSFVQAAGRGRSSSFIHHFLKEHAVDDLPDAIVDALQQWSLQLGRAYFQEVLLVRCKDEEAALQIQRECERELAQGILVPIGSLDYIVVADKADEVAQRLMRLGLFSPDSIGSKGNDKLECPPVISNYLAHEKKENDERTGCVERFASDDLKGTVYSTGSLQYYEMDAVISEANAASAPYNRLPEMWTKSMRTYHASTMKELIQTAIELKLSIEVELQHEERRQLTPWRLQGTPAELTLLEASMDNSNRLNRESFDPKQFRGVRILLPAWL